MLNQILIIQENSTGCDDDICDSPDDEAGQPAGRLQFDFGENLQLFGFDLIDFEGATPGPESGSVTFRSAGVNLATVSFAQLVNFASPFYDATISFGDHTANRINPFSALALNTVFANVSISSFNSVIISFSGSGGVDNITFIPEPSTAVLLGFGFVALAGAARRRYAPRV